MILYRLLIILTDGPLQIRKRADGGRVVQREQHVGEHDRPAFGSLLARSRFSRQFTNQHTRIRCGNDRLSVRRFVSAVPFHSMCRRADSARMDPITERILQLLFCLSFLSLFFSLSFPRNHLFAINDRLLLRDLDRYSA